MCDTESTGTWFLSLLCSHGVDILSNDDDVMGGCVWGTVEKTFLGIAPGSSIFIEVDDKDPLKYNVKWMTKEDHAIFNQDGDMDSWFCYGEEEKVHSKSFRFSIAEKGADVLITLNPS